MGYSTAMLNLIVAASENNVIGKDGDLPWSLPDDLQYFKKVTNGHPIIMGRKCYESIGRPLPGRQNIIISRQSEYAIEGCDIAGSLEEALGTAEGKEVFVIGGGQIYEQALPHVDRIYLTRVHTEIDGDVVFSQLGDEWKEISAERHEADERHEYAFTFVVLEKG